VKQLAPVLPVVERDHRTVKQATWLAKGYGSFPTAWRTLQGIEAMNMIRKGRVMWVARQEQPTRLGNLQGESPCAVNYLYADS
jgi:transposase-like protein